MVVPEPGYWALAHQCECSLSLCHSSQKIVLFEVPEIVVQNII